LKKSTKKLTMCFLMFFLMAAFGARYEFGEADIFDIAAFITFLILGLYYMVGTTNAEDEEKPRMTCPHCGKIATFIDGYCLHCSKSLIEVCPHCDELNLSPYSICRYCGKPPSDSIKPDELINIGHQKDSESIPCDRVDFKPPPIPERILTLKRTVSLKNDDRVPGTEPISEAPSNTAKTTNVYPPKNSSKPEKKTQHEDIYDQLEQHDIENLELMGYEREKKP